MPEISLTELTVRPDSSLLGRSATDLKLRSRHGINLLALSRRGKRSIRRMRSEPIKAGDVMLMQGSPDAVLGFASEYGCVPLAERSIQIPDKRQAVAVTAHHGRRRRRCRVRPGCPPPFPSPPACFVTMALRVVPLRTIYEAIDWPVIVLLGALIPVAGAMETTGAADLIAQVPARHPWRRETR